MADDGSGVIWGGATADQVGKKIAGAAERNKERLCGF